MFPPPCVRPLHVFISNFYNTQMWLRKDVSITKPKISRMKVMSFGRRVLNSLGWSWWVAGERILDKSEAGGAYRGGAHKKACIRLLFATGCFESGYWIGGARYLWGPITTSIWLFKPLHAVYSCLGAISRNTRSLRPSYSFLWKCEQIGV